MVASLISLRSIINWSNQQPIHRSKKDGDMSILSECIAGFNQEYQGKDDKKKSIWIKK